jgi:hypothetical protein
VLTLPPEATLLHTQIVACVFPAVLNLLAVASLLAMPAHFVAGAEDLHLVVVSPLATLTPTTHYARYATAMVTLFWTAITGSVTTHFFFENVQ